MDEEEQLRVQNELRGTLVEVRKWALEEAAKAVEEIGLAFSSQSENRSLVIAMASVFLEVADKIRNLPGDSDG